MITLRILTVRSLRIGVPLILCAVAKLWAQTGQIRGVVRDDSGRAVSNAIVQATAQGAAGSKPATASNATANDGSFALTGLPAGSFLVCIQAPRSSFLNPCEWAAYLTAAPPSITLSAGQVANLSPIVLKQGQVLR